MEEVQRPPLKSKGKQMPTRRMVKAAELMVEMGGGRNQGEIMRRAGYSEAVARTPSKITRSEAFREVMIAHGLTTDLFAAKLQEGLGATKAVVMGTKSEEAFVDVQPDFAVRHKYLETGLRLSGLGREAGDINISFNSAAGEQRDKYGI